MESALSFASFYQISLMIAEARFTKSSKRVKISVSFLILLLGDTCGQFYKKIICVTLDVEFRGFAKKHVPVPSSPPL
jgi:hypothetical protein